MSGIRFKKPGSHGKKEGGSKLDSRGRDLAPKKILTAKRIERRDSIFSGGSGCVRGSVS